MTNTIIKASCLLALSCALALMMTLLSAEQAKSAEITEQDFQQTCFAPDFQPTDGCYSAAETLGIEIDNLNKSADLGCTLENMLEDYSCKGPQYHGYQLISEESEDSSPSSSSDKSAEYFLVDASNISEQDLAVFEANGYFGVAGDDAEQLYSPAYFDGKSISELPKVTQQKIRTSACYDVVGATYESAAIEYIGCPSAAKASEASVSAQETTSGQAQGVSQAAPKQKAQASPVAQRTAEIVAKSKQMLAAHPEFAPKTSSKSAKSTAKAK